MTDVAISKVLQSIVIIRDTREQKFQHILDYLDISNVKHIRRKLDSGDYSFYLEGYENLGLDESIIIERKASGWNEIAGNFTQGRERFVREFERVPEDTTIHLVIEDATFKKLVNGTYRSKLPPKSLLASLLTFSTRYNIFTWTVGKKEVPMMVYELIYYGVREKLKEMNQ